MPVNVPGFHVNEQFVTTSSVAKPVDSPYIATSIVSLIVMELTLTWELMSKIHLKMKHAKAHQLIYV